MSDSQASIKALKKSIIQTQLVSDCKSNLQALCQTNSVQLNWIKAHVGHEGNEEVDKLAKLGAMSPTTDIEPIIPVSKRHIRSIIEQYTKDLWKIRWQHTPTARQTKIFLQSPNKKISKLLLRNDRITLGELGRWILGHNFLLRHNYLIDPFKFPSPMCRQCQEEEETSSHLALQCPALGHDRHRIFGEYLLEPPFTWIPDQLTQMIKKATLLSPEIFPDND
jgi:hypothetical protein